MPQKTSPLALGRSFAVRLVCKAWELACRGLTRLVRLGQLDVTRLLIDEQTPAQREASARLAALPGAAVPRQRIAVLVPFRDRWALTETCLRSLLAQDLNGHELRLVLIDNGSVGPETAAGIDRLAAEHGPMVQHLRVDAPFNFSMLNNRGVEAAKAFAPDWLFLLNNDVEMPDRGTLARLVAFAARAPGAGAVGTTLLYPNGLIQHLFAAPGVKIVAAHPFKGRRLPVDAAWFAAPRPVAAVTGAALLVSSHDFAAVGGFDESLPTVGQDLDLCLKLQRLGRVNWVLPAERLVHHESASRRGVRIDRDEVARLYDRWGDMLCNNPFYSPRLSRWSETPALTPGEPPYPWRLVLP
jgi:GT2 family glycosyltransferase